MPHAQLKLLPGVDQNRTPVLNEAAIQTTNLVRFRRDQQGIGLVEKLGGWSKYVASAFASKVRHLLAWQDTDDDSWLAVGCETQLIAIGEGTSSDITPQTRTDVVAVNVTTTSGSAICSIVDTGSNISMYDSVYIQTQISVGGVTLYGFYVPTPVDANTFQVTAVNALGQPVLATASIANGGAVPQFSTTSGLSTVTVNFNNHGFVVGNTFPVLIATTVGGITFSGNYTIISITSANAFVIQAGNSASSTTTGYMNAGNASYAVYHGIGPLPTGSGYGVGSYGSGGYGTGVAGSPGVGTPITTTDWTLDNFGETLIAVPRSGAIYQWDPEANATLATVIPQAPVTNHGALVAMPQRQVVAWGSTSNGVHDNLLVRWSDVNDFTVWIPTVTNQAGSYRIPRGSTLMQALQGPQQIFLWTDVGVWTMQYIGQPDIYSFTEMGVGCGLIGPKAAATVNGIVYWMGPSQFFIMADQGVQPIPCPIWDVVFQNLDTANTSKIRVAVNTRFNEIAWYFPVAGGNGENSRYAKFNYMIQQWDFGTLDRTAWINESVLGPPIGAATNNYVYQHEVSPDADGQAMNPSFQTGYFALSEGDWKMFVDQVWPDMKWGYYGATQSADVKITFYVADYPGQTPLTFGPFDVTFATTYITPRFRGRLVSIKIESNDIGSFWRLGGIRYRAAQDGKF